MDEPTSAEWVIGEWVTLDRELHPFEALELATVIEAVKLHVLHGWPRWWAWTFASLVAEIAIGILEAAAGELVIVGRILRELIELAERDADAELVDALHDALDVGLPAGGPRR